MDEQYPFNEKKHLYRPVPQVGERARTSQGRQHHNNFLLGALSNFFPQGRRLHKAYRPHAEHKKYGARIVRLHRTCTIPAFQRSRGSSPGSARPSISLTKVSADKDSHPVPISLPVGYTTRQRSSYHDPYPVASERFISVKEIFMKRQSYDYFYGSESLAINNIRRHQWGV